MEIIILAGGFGTRLQNIVKDIPKPMADINGKPFLTYLLKYISRYDVSDIVLSVGYKQDIIKNYYKDTFSGINIKYSSEDEPLGTGGALKKALKLIDDDKCLVLNGDSFFNIDLDSFYLSTINHKLAVAVTMMNNFDRYGTVEVLNGKVISFIEKKFTVSGYINCGVYMTEKKIFDNVRDKVFSFETFLQKQTDITAYIKNSYFIDIGIPDDYKRAKKDFKELF